MRWLGGETERLIPTASLASLSLLIVQLVWLWAFPWAGTRPMELGYRARLADSRRTLLCCSAEKGRVGIGAPRWLV